MIVILLGLVVLTIWGAVAPRGQWRVLAAWTRRNPYASEPGPVSVGVHRAFAIVATIALGYGGFGLLGLHPTSVPQAGTPTSVVQRLWGSPDPHIVNRVVPPILAPPNGLVQQPVLRYQAMDGAHRMPSYLFTLKPWTRTGTVAGEGYIGVDPPVGLTALDTSSIVLQVRGDPNCLPRAVVAVETEKTVAVAVYYGRPDTAPRETYVNVANCSTVLSEAESVSVLIPVPLRSLVGTRTVVGLDSKPIPEATAGR
jgi:hypothetical protein